MLQVDGDITYRAGANQWDQPSPRLVSQRIYTRKQSDQNRRPGEVPLDGIYRILGIRRLCCCKLAVVCRYVVRGVV